MGSSMSLHKSLLQEEKRSAILFLWLFYIVFFLYEFFYFYLSPFYPWTTEFVVRNDINFVKYVLLLILVPFFVYLLKRNKPDYVKYVLFLTYVFINLLTDIWYYWGSEMTYSSGNLVELVVILFSPIFINKRFFYLVSIGSIAKYILIGLVLQNVVVIFPVFFNLVLSLIAFILLQRILSYVDALKQSYDAQLEGLVKGVIATLELKDPYTRGHSERVAEYALSLAHHMGQFKEHELKQFYYSCLLHDIGKVNIPDSVLTKPGKLTDDEYELIKTHPVVGAKSIQDVVGVGDYIHVIYHHHERWDGKGYPDGLKGKETPLLARVTALADAFDAMTSSRSYRSALSLEEAHSRIIAGKGTQFDPELVDLFQEVYPHWVDFYKNYNKS